MTKAHLFTFAGLSAGDLPGCCADGGPAVRAPELHADGGRRHQSRPLHARERPTGCTAIIVDGDAVGGVGAARRRARHTRNGSAESAQSGRQGERRRARRRQRVRARRGERHGALARRASHRLGRARSHACRLCPAAILFDLPVGGNPKIRPTAECGYKAADAATTHRLLKATSARAPAPPSGSRRLRARRKALPGSARADEVRARVGRAADAERSRRRSHRRGERRRRHHRSEHGPDRRRRAARLTARSPTRATILRSGALVPAAASGREHHHRRRRDQCETHQSTRPARMALMARRWLCAGDLSVAHQRRRRHGLLARDRPAGRRRRRHRRSARSPPRRWPQAIVRAVIAGDRHSRAIRRRATSRNEPGADLFRLDGKVAASIGAGSGIGEAVAHGCARARRARRLHRCRRAMPHERVRDCDRRDAEHAAVDIRRRSARGRRRSTASSRRARPPRHRRLHARRQRAQADPRRTPDDDFDRVVAVNFKGSFNVLRAAGRVMTPQRGGSIVLFSSIRSLVVEPGQSVYAATKAAIVQLVRDGRRRVRRRRTPRQRRRARCRRNAADGADQSEQRTGTTRTRKVASSSAGRRRTRWSVQRCSSAPTPRATSRARFFSPTAAGPPPTAASRRQGCKAHCSLGCSLRPRCRQFLKVDFFLS